MVKKIVNVKYQCEVCGRYWADHDTASTCENSPPPRLQVGDMVIWHGCRDPEYAPFQTLVLDFVTKVDVQYDRARPGHPPHYRLSKDWSIDGEIAGARTGYVNVAGAIGYPGLHTDQLHVALRSSIQVDNTAELEQVVATLRAAGFPIHERMAHIYANLRKEQYSLTWASTSPNTTRVHYLSPSQQEALLNMGVILWINGIKMSCCVSYASYGLRLATPPGNHSRKRLVGKGSSRTNSRGRFGASK